MPLGRRLPPFFEPPAQRAPFATRTKDSHGRYFEESESATRTCYSRDRDRIIHSAAFRRLKHKTQVFVQHEGDYYRTRLTHSLEVAQIARSVARVLAVDEDLAETVALAHDLGHTPFGHAGEEALNAATEAFGGFDHNAHALKLVTQIEHRYAEFDGLNLTWETLEGMVKHNGPITAQKKPIPGPIASFNAKWPLDLTTWPGLEAQIAAMADDIAYINHDIDDGLRAELFTIADLREAPIVGPQVGEIVGHYGDLELGRMIGEIVRQLMSTLIVDLISETRRRLEDNSPRSVADIRALNFATAAFSDALAPQVRALKEFMFTRMYRHPHVMGSMNRAKDVVTALFEALSSDPSKLPPDWTKSCGAPGEGRTVSVVRDYIAGMTDNYALLEYSRVFHKEIAL
jgi:dGTPase